MYMVAIVSLVHAVVRLTCFVLNNRVGTFGSGQDLSEEELNYWLN